MLLFGFIHVKAFSYLPYRPEDRTRTTMRGKAVLDALDFRDWFFEMKESTRYIAARSKGRNYTLAEDLRAQRHQHLLNALGTQRTADLNAEMDMEKAAMPTFWKNPEDAQFWTPSGDGSQSGFSSKHHSADTKNSFRPSNGGGDSYSPLPNAASRGFRPGSKLASSTLDRSQGASQRDSHTLRAAELQRLVAELDLQDADLSMAATEDHDYGYEDEKFERTGLMHSHGRTSKHLDSLATKDAELHPELTQYHAANVQLANVPSLSYDHETVSSNPRRMKNLSATAEEEVEAPLARKGSRTAPSVGAFGMAAWLGWGSGTQEAQPQHQPQQQQQQPAQKNDYLRPSDAYANQPQAGGANGVDGTGWWRNYWDRMSAGGSREPSIAGVDEEEKEPLNIQRPAIMREVTQAHGVPAKALASGGHCHNRQYSRSRPARRATLAQTVRVSLRRHHRILARTSIRLSLA